MAVTQTNASAGITWIGSTSATASGTAIGTAATDRIVLVGISIEADVNFSSCTIGGITATLAGLARDTGGTPDEVTAFFYARVPTGTTANITVVVSASISLSGRMTVWALFGATLPHFDVNTNIGSGATLTLGGVTIPANGMGFWVFANATAATAIAWTNATERDDTSVVNYRHGSADSAAAGTLTITADGATAAQAISGISFDQVPNEPAFETSNGAWGFEVPHLRSLEVVGT